MRIHGINYNSIYHQYQLNQVNNEIAVNKSSAVTDFQYVSINQNYLKSYCPNFTANFPKTLYRAIYKPEYESLMKNGYSKGEKFCSLNPKGWAGSQWENGFGYGHNNIYFVTYKKNIFPTSRIIQLDNPYYKSNGTQNWGDVRFLIKDGFTLDDIECIRKGNNECGKIIWAHEKSIIAEDKLKQKQRIEELINAVIADEKFDNLDDIDELHHWCRKHHDIPQKIIDKTNDKFSQALIYYMIESTNDKRYLQYIKDKIANNARITPHLIKYLKNVGGSDLLKKTKITYQ